MSLCEKKTDIICNVLCCSGIISSNLSSCFVYFCPTNGNNTKVSLNTTQFLICTFICLFNFNFFVFCSTAYKLKSEETKLRKKRTDLFNSNHTEIMKIFLSCLHFDWKILTFLSKTTDNRLWINSNARTWEWSERVTEESLQFCLS